MKTVCLISGTSTGIGKAIAEKLLQEKVAVYGFGRRCTVKHTRYTHQSLDLRDLSAVLGIEFPSAENAERIILINNAGIIGDVKPIGKLGDLSIAEIVQVNLTAPAMLTNKFLQAYGNLDIPLVVVNISSGAARYPIPSWSGYCASKAGLEMFSQVLATENRHKSIRVHSVSPGVVDTPMQDEIRSVPKADFEMVNDFIEYKKRGELTTPGEVASKLWRLLEDEAMAREVIVSFRDYPSAT